MTVTANDEAFWREQERRLAGGLGQPCCSVSGMCSLLRTVAGNFAVVVHGERDCLNSFQLDEGPATVNFYTTDIGEEEFTAGESSQALRRCLQLLVRDRQPEVIFVLSTCLVEMAGEDIAAIAREFSGNPVPVVVPLRTGGLRLGSQAEMLDWLYATLAELPPQDSLPGSWFARLGQLGLEMFLSHRRRNDARAREWMTRCRRLHESPTPPQEARVNLIGFPELTGGALSELTAVLEKSGLELNGIYPFGATLADWRAIGRAGHSLVVDSSLFERLGTVLAAGGQRVVEVPLPVGMEQSLRFYELLLAAAEQETAVSREFIVTARRRAEQALADFRRRWQGLKLAMGVRLLNNYRADQLAYDGLGDLAALEEMGFAITLLVQGPPSEEARRQFAGRLQQLGCRVPFEVFPDPWMLGDLLADGGFELAYLADHSREEAERAGIPMITSRGLHPLLAGVTHNTRRLHGLLARRLPGKRDGKRRGTRS